MFKKRWVVINSETGQVIRKFWRWKNAHAFWISYVTHPANCMSIRFYSLVRIP